MYKRVKKNIITILYVSVLLLDFIVNLVVINVLCELIWNNNSTELSKLILALLVKGLLHVSLFYLKRKKELLHGKFKTISRREFIEAIFLTKRVEDSKHTGELTTDLWMGIEWMGVYYFDALPDLIFKLTFLICGIFYMLYVSYRLALLFAATLTIIFLIEKIFDPLVSKSSQKEGQINQEYSMMSMDALNGAETLKSLNGIDYYKAKLSNVSASLKNASMSFVYLGSMSNIGETY